MGTMTTTLMHQTFDVDELHAAEERIRELSEDGETVFTDLLSNTCKRLWEAIDEYVTDIKYTPTAMVFTEAVRHKLQPLCYADTGSSSSVAMWEATI